MNVEEIISEVDKVGGWFAPGQQRLLYPIIKELKPNSLLVEIGTAFGRSAYFFSLVNPLIKIITVDKIPYKITRNLSYQGLGEDVNVLGQKNIKQIVGDSGEVGISFGEKVDFLFIDGDHTYEGVKKDIDTWIPFIKVGGYVAFHDHDWVGRCKEDNRVAEAVENWFRATDCFESIYLKSCIRLVKRNK